MNRMSREFGLVLLGAGILTAGYFTAPSPEEEMEKKADEQAAERTGHDQNRPYHRHGVMPFFLFVHSPAYAGSPSGRPASYSPTTRAGGFGTAGRAFSGGGS